MLVKQVMEDQEELAFLRYRIIQEQTKDVIRWRQYEKIFSNISFVEHAFICDPLLSHIYTTDSTNVV